ncbi:MAG TPA: serine/threonine-protein kinase [Caldimonas sp.]
MAGATSSHSLTLLAGTRLGEFEITQTIGEGGFGIVYSAWDHSLDRRVALKEYMPSSLAVRSGQAEIQPRSERHRETFEAGLKSFVNEAKLLAQFDHPSLLKVYRFWEANGTAYMVMPFLEGLTLRDTVRAMPEPPNEAWILGLLSPLCDALAMLHAAQIYHRDIAPDNIHLLADTGRPLLLDFGAARRVIGDMTQALTAILKPGYAPVEQYADIPGLKQGPWTDVYALAAVVHWMVTGKTPPPSVGRMFDDAQVPLAQRAAGRYSSAFLEAVDRALVVMPDKRTQTIDDFRNDLSAIAPSGATVTQAREPSAAAATRAPVAPATSAAAATTVTTGRATQASREEQRREPATQTLAAAPPESASRAQPAAARPLPWAVPAAVVGGLALVVAVGYFLVVKPAPAPVAPAPPPGASLVTAPATIAPEIAAGASSVATVPQVPVPEPVNASVNAPVNTATSSPLHEQGAEPSEAAVVANPAPARHGAAVVDGAPKPGNGEARPALRKAIEARPERRDEPAAGQQHAGNANQAECARLFQRLSIGESSPELIERVRTLHCR